MSVDDRLVRRADAGQVGQGHDRGDAARAVAGGGCAGGPAGRSGPDAARIRRRRARAVRRLGPRRRCSCRARGRERDCGTCASCCRGPASASCGWTAASTPTSPSQRAGTTPTLCSWTAASTPKFADLALPPYSVIWPGIRRRIRLGGRNGELARVPAAIGAGRWRAAGRVRRWRGAAPGERPAVSWLILNRSGNTRSRRTAGDLFAACVLSQLAKDPEATGFGPISVDDLGWRPGPLPDADAGPAGELDLPAGSFEGDARPGSGDARPAGADMRNRSARTTTVS